MGKNLEKLRNNVLMDQYRDISLYRCWASSIMNRRERDHYYNHIYEVISGLPCGSTVDGI